MADDYKKIEEAYTGARDNARELLDTLLNKKMPTEIQINSHKTLLIH